VSLAHGERMRNRLPFLFTAIAALAAPACDPETPKGAMPDGQTEATFNVTVTVHPGPAATDSGHYAVQFLDKAGNLITQTETTIDGTARALIEPGATVIVIGGKSGHQDPKNPKLPTGPGGPYAVKAVLGLQPGDDIQLDLAAPEESTAKASGKFTVAFAAKAGATKYLVTDACSGGLVAVAAPPATFPMFKGCEKKKAAIVVAAYDDTGLVGVASAKDVELKADGKLEKTSDWAAPATFAAQVAGIDATIDGVAIARWSTIGLSNQLASAKPAGATLDASFAIATDTGAAVQTALTAGTDHRQFIVDSIAGDATSYHLDLATKLLPWLDAPTIKIEAAAAGSKTTIHAPARGTGTYDLFEATAQLSRTVTVDQTTKDSKTMKETTTHQSFPLDISWTVISDKAGDVVLPKLVGELAIYNPTATAPAPVEGVSGNVKTVTSATADTATATSSRIVDLEDAAGYDQARQAPYAAFARAQQPGSADDLAAKHGARVSIFGK
jgi:hypothetical protein